MVRMVSRCPGPASPSQPQRARPLVCPMAPFVSVVVPVRSLDSGEHVKLLLPLDALAAFEAREPSWCWLPSHADAFDANLAPHTPAWARGSLRASAGLAGKADARRLPSGAWDLRPRTRGSNATRSHTTV